MLGFYLNAHTLAVIFKAHLVLMHLDHAAEQRKEERGNESVTGLIFLGLRYLRAVRCKQNPR